MHQGHKLIELTLAASEKPFSDTVNELVPLYNRTIVLYKKKFFVHVVFDFVTYFC